MASNLDDLKSTPFAEVAQQPVVLYQHVHARLKQQGRGFSVGQGRGFLFLATYNGVFFRQNIDKMSSFPTRKIQIFTLPHLEKP